MSQESERQVSPTGVNVPDETARLLGHVETRGVRFINLEFTDVVGMAKAVTIPAEQLPDCLEYGKWFDGSAIEGFARVAETDMYLRPDLATYAEVPWRPSVAGGAGESGGGRVARIICDVLMPTGERFEGDPRAVLIAALAEAAALGYRYEVSPELEFFLLPEGEGAAREPLPHDRGGYFDLSTDLAADVRREIVSELSSMGVRVESSHHEVAAGQHELDFVPDDALRIADAVITARYAIKAIAQRHGLWATFLPKPFYGINGSGMHTHQRLIRLEDGADVFADSADSQYGLSTLGRQFIAGQLAHAAGMCAVVAPLVNSYKRLVSGFEAPVMISWGRVNREALVRVPRVSPGALGGMRIELRSPDPSCNPYLAFAVMLRAGLNGAARELPLPPPVEEGLYTLDEQVRLRRGIGILPATLGEALTALQQDEVVSDALGQQIAAWFIEAKTQEWAEYRRQVHPWELERYLPLF
jgi:glutamine synthetase